MDIYFDFGGPKEKALKQKKEFVKVAESMGITPVPLRKLFTKRFRSYRIANQFYLTDMQ